MLNKMPDLNIISPKLRVFSIVSCLIMLASIGGCASYSRQSCNKGGLYGIWIGMRRCDIGNVVSNPPPDVVFLGPQNEGRLAAIPVNVSNKSDTIYLIFDDYDKLTSIACVPRRPRL